MFKLNQIFQLRGRAFIRDSSPAASALSFTVYTIKRPSNLRVFIRWDLQGRGGTRLRTPASLQPKTDDQQR